MRQDHFRLYLIMSFYLASPAILFDDPYCVACLGKGIFVAMIKFPFHCECHRLPGYYILHVLCTECNIVDISMGKTKFRQCSFTGYISQVPVFHIVVMRCNDKDDEYTFAPELQNLRFYARLFRDSTRR